MNDNLKATIIENMIPQFIRDEYPNFVEFIKVYYTHQDQEGEAYQYIANILDFMDVDRTDLEYLDNFSGMYMASFSDTILEGINKRTLVKNIRQFYESAGSEKSFKFLFKILFDEDVELYYPSDDVLRVSDGKWEESSIIKISNNEDAEIAGLVGTEIVGGTSGARGLVETVEIYEASNGFLIAELALSTISPVNDFNEFLVGETVTGTTLDGQTTIVEHVYSIITGVDIVTNDLHNQPGDVIEIAPGPGVDGYLVVQSVESGGIESMEVIEGGTGYSVNDIIEFNSSTGLAAKAYVATIGGSGEILTVDIVSTGHSYESMPTYNIVSSGTGAVLYPVSSTIGKIKEIEIGNAGVNYFGSDAEGFPYPFPLQFTFLENSIDFYKTAFIYDNGWNDVNYKVNEPIIGQISGAVGTIKRINQSSGILGYYVDEIAYDKTGSWKGFEDEPELLSTSFDGTLIGNLEEAITVKGDFYFRCGMLKTQFDVYSTILGGMHTTEGILLYIRNNNKITCYINGTAYNFNATCTIGDGPQVLELQRIVDQLTLTYNGVSQTLTAVNDDIICRFVGAWNTNGDEWVGNLWDMYLEDETGILFSNFLAQNSVTGVMESEFGPDVEFNNIPLITGSADYGHYWEDYSDRENLLKYSQWFNFGETVWYTPQILEVSMTDNVTIAPDGTMTACRFERNAATGANCQQLIAMEDTGETFTFSVYVKSDSLDRYIARWIAYTDGTVQDYQSAFNMTTGLFENINGVGESVAEDVGNGWWRVSVTRTQNNTGNTRIRFDIGPPSGDIGSIFVWGAQITRRGRKEYTHTILNNIVGKIPADPSYVRTTNLLRNSEEFDHGAWAKTRSTIIPDKVYAPDGTLTGDELKEDLSLNTTHRAIQVHDFEAGNEYTFSVYVKAGSVEYLNLLYPSAAFGSDIKAWFNLLTGLPSKFAPLVANQDMEYVGQNWYRCSVTATCTTTSSNSCFIQTSLYNDESYDGAENSFYIWGAQLDEGPVALPYVYTEDIAEISQSNYQYKPQDSSFNYQRFSNQFEEHTISAGMVVTDNSEIDPEGNLTATNVTTNAASQYIYQNFDTIPGQKWTFSQWVKLINQTDAVFGIYDVTNTTWIESQIFLDADNTWKRYTYSFTAPDDCIEMRVYPARAWGASTTGEIAIWHSELAHGDEPNQSYIETGNVASGMPLFEDVPILPELVTNNTFSDWTDPTFPDGWDLYDIANPATEYVEEAVGGGMRVVSSSGDGWWMIYDDVFEIGKTYEIRLKLKSIVSGGVKVTTIGYPRFEHVNDTNELKYIFTALWTSLSFQPSSFVSTDCVVEYVYVKEVEAQMVPVGLINEGLDVLGYELTNPGQTGIGPYATTPLEYDTWNQWKFWIKTPSLGTELTLIRPEAGGGFMILRINTEGYLECAQSGEGDTLDTIVATSSTILTPNTDYVVEMKGYYNSDIYLYVDNALLAKEVPAINFNRGPGLLIGGSPATFDDIIVNGDGLIYRFQSKDTDENITNDWNVFSHENSPQHIIYDILEPLNTQNALLSDGSEIPFFTEDISSIVGFEKGTIEYTRNGDFSAGQTEWSKSGAGTSVTWELDNGKMSIDGTQDASKFLIQDNVIGTSVYIMSFELSNVQAGGVRIVGQGGGAWDSGYVTTNGVHEFTLDTSLTINADILVGCDVDFIGSVDNISVRDAIKIADDYPLDKSNPQTTFIDNEEIIGEISGASGFNIYTQFGTSGLIVPGSISKYNGAYRNTDGFVSGDKYIQDSYYYQDFSYAITTLEDQENWIGPVKDMLHPAGTIVFGFSGRESEIYGYSDGGWISPRLNTVEFYKFNWSYQPLDDGSNTGFGNTQIKDFADYPIYTCSELREDDYSPGYMINGESINTLRKTNVCFGSEIKFVYPDNNQSVLIDSLNYLLIDSTNTLLI